MSQATLRYSVAELASQRDTLYGVLAVVRRRLLWISMTSGLCWATVGLVLVLLAGMWLDLVWELSPEGRLTIWGIGGCVAVSILVSTLVQTRTGLQDRALVRHIDRAAGTGGDVLTGLELDRPNPMWSGTTAGLARLATGRAGRVASTVSAQQAISARPLQRAATAGLVVLIAVGLFSTLFPRLAWTQWSRMISPYADVPPFSPLQFEIKPGDVEVRYGMGLEVLATISGGNANRAELVLTNNHAEEILPMFPEADGRWRAVLSRIYDPAQYHVRAGRARSSQYNITVITVPRIEQVRVRITPPAYTHRPPYDGLLPKEGAYGLPGTQVEMWARSNRPLSSGTIKVVGGEQPELVAMHPSEDPHEVVGQFVITHSGRFDLNVRDIAEEESLEPVHGTVTLLNDDHPLVRILQPLPMSLATPEADLPVELVAEDDYGVSRLTLYRSLNDSSPLPHDQPLPTIAPTRHGTKVVLPLSTYGLLPGDVIKLFARVEDNDPAGPKGFESSIVSVRIISQEEFERMKRMRAGLDVLMSKYRQADRNLESLLSKADRLRQQTEEMRRKDGQGSNPSSPLSEDHELRRELRRLAEENRKSAQALRRANEKTLPYDLDKELSPELQKLAEELEKQAGDLENLANAPELTAEELENMLKQLRQKMQSEQEEFQEKAMLPLEQLERLFPLIEGEARFENLVEQQVDLAGRMATLKGHDGEDDPAQKVRMRELQEQQQSLKEELLDLLKEIEENAMRLPEEPEYDELRASALEFADKVTASGAAGMMGEADAALGEFAGTRAAEKAQEAADTLKQFLEHGQAMSGKVGQVAGRRFSPGVSKSLGNTIGQMLAERGMGRGKGGGRRGEGGYSVRQNSLNKMGLYGRSHGGEEMQGDSHGLGPNGEPLENRPGGMNPDQMPIISTGAGSSTAGGAGDPAIPLQFRRRVGQYFQRLADEADNGP